MQAIKKQWFTLLLMIIQAVIIIFIQPEIGSVSLCNLMFIAIFAEDERNVFLKLAWEDKFYFYVQCIVMYLMTLIFGLILALDHGSGSITVTTKAFNALQMINIILRFIMTYGLIAQEEDRRKLYFHSVLMLVFFVQPDELRRRAIIYARDLVRAPSARFERIDRLHGFRTARRPPEPGHTQNLPQPAGHGGLRIRAVVGAAHVRVPGLRDPLGLHGGDHHGGGHGVLREGELLLPRPRAGRYRDVPGSRDPRARAHQALHRRGRADRGHQRRGRPRVRGRRRAARALHRRPAHVHACQRRLLPLHGARRHDVDDGRQPNELARFALLRRRVRRVGGGAQRGGALALGRRGPAGIASRLSRREGFAR